MVIEMEKNEHDANFVDNFKDIKPNYYNRWLVVLMVGFACASFSYLQGVI